MLIINILGSPPRMRGIPWLRFNSIETVGITPAHAGNTRGVTDYELEVRDHPRACGEYSCAYGNTL